MEVVLAALRPKTGHASQEYRPQLYEILLLDSKTPAGEKVKPAKYLPMFPMKVVEEEPRELVLTQLYRVTGGDVGQGIKGERALQVNWNKDLPGAHRESLARFSLFFVPISPSDKLNKKFVGQAQNSPEFYPLEHVIDAVNNNSIHFPSPTRTFLLHLESWLREKHSRSSAVDCLFRPRAEFRIHLTVHNPVFIPSRISSEEEATGNGKRPHLPPEIQLTANEALAKMLAIEKCDTVVMNPLFGSGLPYKAKVNAFEINQHWPIIPDYSKITVPLPYGSPEPRWQDKYPVHNAAAFGDAGEVEMLLQQGWQHSQRDTISWTPLHYAAWYGNVTVVEVLLSSGSSPNVTDQDLTTPLHIAAKKGYHLITQTLLQCPDIDMNVKDKDGKRPLDVCFSVPDKTAKHDQVIKLLQEHRVQQPLMEVVYTMDQVSHHVKLMAGTTVSQINHQLMKEFNLPKTYSDLFTIWICSKSLELQLKSEHEVVTQVDMWQKRTISMLTDARPDEEKPRLVWRRNVKVSVDREKELQHPKAEDLLFHEAYHNYISGLYPCLVPDVIMFATTLFCLHHRGATTASARSILSNADYLNKLIPVQLMKTKTVKDWVSKILKEYSASILGKDIAQQTLKRQFLTHCQKLTVYGSAFFTGYMQVAAKSSGFNLACHIGVNDVGIHIIHSVSKDIVQSCSYGEMQWKHIGEHQHLVLTIAKKPEGKKGRSLSTTVLKFRTHQAGLIAQLMQNLAPARNQHGSLS